MGWDPLGLGNAGIDDVRKELGKQGDQWYKEIGKQGDQWYKKLDELAADLVPLAKSSSNTAQILGLCTGFCEVAFGATQILNAVSGAMAQRKLDDFYTKLGGDVEAIRNSLKTISEDVGVLVNHKSQHKFAEHVYDYVRMRGDQLASAKKHENNESIDYLFVYHHGDEWCPAFHRLNNDSPLPNLCGIFHNLDLMANCLLAFRKAAGEKAIFHVLMPATSLYFVYDIITFPQELQPLVMEGELHNGTGLPYNYFTVLGARSEMFYNVKNMADIVSEPEPLPQQETKWKKVASTSAAWGAGIPAGVGSAAGGFCVAAAAVPAGPAVVASAAVVSGVVLGATGGTKAGRSVGKKVEDWWDRG